MSDRPWVAAASLERRESGGRRLTGALPVYSGFRTQVSERDVVAIDDESGHAASVRARSNQDHQKSDQNTA